MRRSDILRTLLALTFGAVLTWGGVGLGCNPSFVQSLGGAAALPTAPGQAPYILLRLTNAISVPPSASASQPATVPTGVGYQLTWRYAGGQTGAWNIGSPGLSPSEDIGMLVDCNMTIITLGNINDVTADGAWLIYGNNTTQPLEPFGKILQNGVDFRCGDTLTFVTFLDPTNSRNYAADYQVQSGQNVIGPFSGPDTFMLYDQQSQDWVAGEPY
jgi:hypothetical protein